MELNFTDLPLGSNVTSLTCSDKDLGPSGNFSFTIVSGNTGNKFRMDDNRVIVNGALDHENGSEYSLKIHVTDQGIPSHVTVVMVTVYVKAVNEFTPKFQYSNYTVSISEATAVGKFNFFFIFNYLNLKVSSKRYPQQNQRTCQASKLKSILGFHPQT